MVNGTLYTTAGSRRAVVALDAAHRRDAVDAQRERRGARRGGAAAALRPRAGLLERRHGKDERILYVTPGYRLIALDAKTGAPIPSFGTRGVVDLKLDNDQEIDLVTGEMGLQAAPVVAGNTIIIGAAHLVSFAPKSKTNVKGYVRGLRRADRQAVLDLPHHSAPRRVRRRDAGTTRRRSAFTGNTGVWAQISVDEELGLAYLPVELPTGDFYGGHRPGNGLFGESLVAVDLKTGKRKWHYQLVHHGIWDWDIPCAPDPRRPHDERPDDQGRRAADQAVVDLPVRPGRPASRCGRSRSARCRSPTCRCEKTSPTQPFPTKPPAFDRQGVSVDDLIDFTPELRAEALKLVSRYKLGPIYTPPIVSKWDGLLGTLVTALEQRRAELAGGRGRSSDRYHLYIFVHADHRPRAHP